MTVIQSAIIVLVLIAPLPAQQIPLQAVVTPSTTISKDGHTVTFALDGFIEFETLAEMFPYIESQTRRWKNDLDDSSRRHLASELLRRGIESRIVSMIDERPFEALVTHTREELQQALAQVKEPVPPASLEKFVRESAALSPIGIRLKKVFNSTARLTIRPNISGKL